LFNSKLNGQKLRFHTPLKLGKFVLNFGKIQEFLGKKNRVS